MAAVVLEHATRCYQKYAARHRFQTFKSAVVKGDLFGSLRSDEVVAAVEDVNLTIEKGTTLGLIGRNGSGKSTLLKLIAGISKPSSGTVKVEGKISALIELGAGFHPEISGRENVFINGIMLGLTKKEITAKFDEIVRFAGLEDFIDAPVKTYSSGMFMRLGFSIAINVNPDVLLVDEVLAVGDAAFIPKCLDRIDDFRRRQKTILFVSHDLAMVAKICDQVAWMKDGRLRMLGDPQEVVDAYLQDVAEKQENDFKTRQAETIEAVAGESAEPPAATDDGRRERRWGKREIEIRKVVLRSLDGTEKHVFSPEDGMLVELDVAARAPQDDFVFGIGVFNSLGTLCYGTNTDLEEHDPQSIEGAGKVDCRIDRLGLVNGTYYHDVAFHKRDGYPYDYHRNMYTFLVSSLYKDEGIIRFPHKWEFGSHIKIKPADK
ncbi:MAG: ABC transporter ATP-binding protein [Candidatus Aminicenantes bacterium]|nr:ABC transporter ATP-binding protein [Candidatus Aminicenantes bacterium]